MGHVLAGGQLAVRDVEEVRPADQLHQAVPGGDVRLVVGRVAVQQAVRERHRPVGADGQREHELLQIGAMVLGVAQRGGRGRLAAARAAVRAFVVAVQADRRRVVVQLRAVDVELGDHAEHQRGQQRAPIGVKELIKRPAEPVVVEQPQILAAEPEQRRVIARGPLGQAVERLTRNAQVAHQQPDRRARAQRDAPVAGAQMTLQQPGQADPHQEPVDDRQRPQPPGAQLKRAALIVFRHQLEVSY